MSGYCTVSIGSGLVDSIYGNCQVPLKSYLEKRGEAFERESLLKYLFRMETSRPLGRALQRRDGHGQLRSRGRGRRLPQDRIPGVL